MLKSGKRKVNTVPSYPLDYQGISRITHEVSDYLKNQGIDRKEFLRTRLSIEELLMKYMEHFQDTVPCELSLTKRFGQIRVLLRIKGASFDPQGDLSEEDSFYNTCMRNLNLAPTWSYRNGENRISPSELRMQQSCLSLATSIPT